jgi:hypothetical protein
VSIRTLDNTDEAQVKDFFGSLEADTFDSIVVTALGRARHGPFLELDVERAREAVEGKVCSRTGEPLCLPCERRACGHSASALAEVCKLIEFSMVIAVGGRWFWFCAKYGAVVWFCAKYGAPKLRDGGSIVFCSGVLCRSHVTNTHTRTRARTHIR